MWFPVPSELSSLAGYLPRFLALVGEDRWFRRVDQLDREQRLSPYLAKIVADYHWLEMAISYQSDILSKQKRLLPELVDAQSLAAIHFAGAVVEIHSRLSPHGQRRLKGCIRDALKADSGFAALYIELDLALRIMSQGFDVAFPDLEGEARYDLRFSRGDFVGEVECKSLSADAGRQVHRKDFYRLMHELIPATTAYAQKGGQEVVIVTLEGRLAPAQKEQARLRAGIGEMLKSEAPDQSELPGFKIERRPVPEFLPKISSMSRNDLYSACVVAFGQNVHVAGGFTEGAGPLIVVRSKREDDTSKPWLIAMEAALEQFSGMRPSFIVVQFQDIVPVDLMSESLRRRAEILSAVVFARDTGRTVNATYFCGYASSVLRNGRLGAPAFSVVHPEPRFFVSDRDVSPFLGGVPDQEFADILGTSLPGFGASFDPDKKGADS